MFGLVFVNAVYIKIKYLCLYGRETGNSVLDIHRYTDVSSR